MGDGGVACAPSQHVMEKFTICGGKTNGNTKLKNASKSTIKIVKVKRKMKPKKDKLKELASKAAGTVNKDVSESNPNCDALNSNNTEEVEEGELVTLPVENGEFVPEKTERGYEIKSEVVEVGPGKWRKIGGSVKSDGKISKDELEKGEFVPGTRCRSDAGNRTDEYGIYKTRRYDAARDRGWRRDRELSPPSGELTPPSSGKCSSEKELGRSAGSSQHLRKLSSRYEVEKTQRSGSKIVGEEGCLRNDSTNSKSHGRESSFNNRLKRHLNDSDSADRKYHAEYDEHSYSKNRRLSDDSSRSSFSSDHQSGRTIERPNKTVAAPSSGCVPSEKYSSRYVESSKGVHDKHNNNPRHSERSPQDRARSPSRHTTQGNQYDRSRSPYDRSRHHDKRYKSPTCLERSPRGGRNREGREHTPTFSERSPRERGRHSEHRGTSRKGGVIDKRPSHGSKGQERKHNIVKDSVGRELEFVAKESEKGNVDKRHAMDKTAGQLCQQKYLSDSLAFKNLESSQTNGEEVASMEVDMEICNTPPHTPVVVDTAAGKWYYLDNYGVERGPSKLSDLKTLLKEGYLVSDHLIKHLDSERWVSVEKAVSPLVTENFVSVVPDTVTQLASPPEAPGNISADSGNVLSCEEEMLGSTSSHLILSSDDKFSVSKPLEDSHIDDRVGTLLGDATLVPGKEVEILADLLQVAFQPGQWERGGKFEELISKDAEYGSPIPASAEKENALTCIDTSASFTGYWVCKGCDWKRNDDASQERTWKRKHVLNDGYPLCQMPKSGWEDPRWEQKDDLYYPSQSKRLDLPTWAFTSPDELNDPSSTGRSTQNKSIVARGVRGFMLPVVRINACVVMDHGSFVSEPRVKVRGKEKFLSRSSRSYSTTGDVKKSPGDGPLKNSQEQHSLEKFECSITRKDHLCTIDELKLQLGNWYYLDGAGHERGPLAFPELQVMAEQGVIQKQSSVFRKSDNVWVPVTVPSKPSEYSEYENNMTTTNISQASGAALISDQRTSGSLHGIHPQLIGYTRGKLHELVMKSYKSREFAAAINEVLDPWINARQPKKEIDKYIYNSDYFTSRTLGDFEDGYKLDEDAQTFQKDDYEFDDLCGDATFKKGDELNSDVESGGWNMLDGHVLARVFHFLRGDAKSLFYAALTCKHWRSVVMFYKGISRQVDFSSIAPICSDAAIVKIMNDYRKENITSLLLRGCTSITFGTVEELLQLFPLLSTIDIRGCFQFDDLVCKFPNVKWVRSRDHHSKARSLNHLANWSSLTANKRDDSCGLKEYLESSDKRDAANQLFRRSLYKRSKLFDARKSSSILSRDAQLRRLAIKKIGSGYKKLEEYIATSLRDIMRENTFDVFGPKVAGIEERMRNGYYASRGLKSIKDDISRMCRDAIKINYQGDARDMNRVITSFLRLVTSLDKGTKPLNARDNIESLKDSPPGFSSSFSKYKKKTGKVSERNHAYRSNGTLFNSGVFDSGDYSSDREIKRRLSKLNKKSLDTGSDTSDDFDRSSDPSRLLSEGSASETESDIESMSEGFPGESRGETYFASENGFDSMTDEREWGARMTKAGLVPPVTRKYEVIDHYVVVADEEEVRRKMKVSLPEDYDEKLIAQRNGTEESDMEIPEVKDFKPRKLLGDEVIEQEVYGIDPYTHNLLLDSIPEESDWSLADRHSFIEEVLLRTLNKQVRDFTGSGNTPMMYPLRPVLEEILETAEKNFDRRTTRACQFIIEAIDNRLDDNYVAYRKGLGVVCNKEGGFGGDDFVVEFLGEVYPTWKWFEKQDGIRALQKNNNDPAPEFYNIYLERPKGDADGYDLVVVDAMHKANYASRICHSCRPNCEAKVTAVDGQYQIGIYCVRPIAYGEEITFDYNSVTESKEEYEASVCLCGNQVCRGSYLNLTGEGAFEKVLEEHHGLLDRHRLLLEACELNSVCEEDYIELGKAGLGSCLLGGLPDWLVAYSARLVRYINFERTTLPAEILKHNIEEKKRYFAEIHMEVEKSDAEIQAEGVYNQRLQNLALTIDKVRYVMRCIFGDPKNAPPPLERLTPEEAASYLWQGEGSFVEELTQYMAPHMEDSVLSDLKFKIHDLDPCSSDDAEMKLRKSLLWLRDEVRNLPCTYNSRHDAAADLIHIYAHTKCFLRITEYKPVTSPPVYITPLDLGPKYADKLGSGVHEYCKTYGETYCLGQLIFWYNQNAHPDAILAKASRGCLSLPDVGSFYAKIQKPSRQLVYGPRTLKFMLARMEKLPQRAWPKDRIWTFKGSPRVVGSPMLDAVLDNSATDREMIHWLKHRPSIYHATWDR